jgi:hypothetical protein
VVPTDLERSGNFSQLVDSTGAMIPMYPPRSTTAFPSNTINTPLDPAAVALLKFLPEPNLDNAGINYRVLTTQGTHGNTLGVSDSQNFGALSSDQSSPQSLNINFNYGDLSTDVINIFPQLSGKQRTQNYALTVSYTIINGEWVTNLNVTSACNNAQQRNPYTNGDDIATKLGLFGDMSTTPFTPVNTNPQILACPTYFSMATLPSTKPGRFRSSPRLSAPPATLPGLTARTSCASAATSIASNLISSVVLTLPAPTFSPAATLPSKVARLPIPSPTPGTPSPIFCSACRNRPVSNHRCKRPTYAKPSGTSSSATIGASART